MSKRHIALEAYETLAERYAALVETKPHNAYYERPATLSLLPPVQGKRVLDAGCGPGVYAAWLLDHGAEVVALDLSPKMASLAHKRVGQRALILRGDLERPLPFEEASFDLVLSALALDYVEDWAGTFGEFWRILRRPGHLVFSVGHPLADFLFYRSENYFQTEQVACEWRGFGIPVWMPAYRRPLSAVLNPLIAAGFVLERVLEPTPTEQFCQHAPEDYEKLSRQPGFLCVRAAKL